MDNLHLRKELNVCKHIIIWTSDMAHCDGLSPYSPSKTRFINTSTAILMYFLNTTLKFSAILDGKLNST